MRLKAISFRQNSERSIKSYSTHKYVYCWCTQEMLNFQNGRSKVFRFVQGSSKGSRDDTRDEPKVVYMRLNVTKVKHFGVPDNPFEAGKRNTKKYTIISKLHILFDSVLLGLQRVPRVVNCYFSFKTCRWSC